MTIVTREEERDELIAKSQNKEEVNKVKEEKKSDDRIDNWGSLRFIGSFIVILAHLWIAKSAWALIVLFFNVSGLLITNQSLQVYFKKGKMDVFMFWQRRIARIMPAVFLLLLIICIWIKATTVFYPDKLTGEDLYWLRQDTVWALFWGSNWEMSMKGEDYFAEFQQVSLLRHFWSLAIEEQYYLVWPVLFNMWIIVVPKVGQCLGLLNTQDGNTRFQQDVVLWSLFLGEVIVIAISYCYMHYLISIGSPHYILHFSTVAHMKDFALGGLVAIYCELLQPLRGILPSKQKYVPQLSTVHRLTLECGMLVASIHVFLIVPFSPIDLTWYYSYGSFVLSAETLMVLILLAVFQKERLQGDRMFTIFPIYFFYNDLYAMLGIAAYALYVFHLPIIVWTDAACHSSSDVYCLARGAIVIIFILIVASVISFKFEVPLMLRIAAVKKFSSVFIGMVSSMVLMLCLILLVTKGAENPRGTSSDLDNMGGLSHPLNIDGNSSHAYYTLIENRAFHNSLLNELSPFFANQGIFESTGLPGSTDATKIIDLNLYETFDSIGKGVSINVLVVLKSKRSCTLLELLPSWIKTQRQKYLNLIGGIHLLAIYDSQLPHDKKIDGLTSACEVDGIIPTLVDSITQIDVSKINNTKFMNLCLDDCRYAMGSWNTNIFDGITLTELRQALAGMVVSILEQAPQLGPFFDKNVVVEEYESNGNTVAGVDKSSDGQLGIAVVGDSTAHRFGIYIKRLYPAIMDKCKQNGQNNTFMRTMQRYKVYNLGVPGLNFPTEISKPESNLRTGLRKSISHFDVTVAMLSSAHLSWELITPNLADRAFGNLLSTLNFLYDTGVKRVYMVDCQYSYETTTVQKGYRIPKKEFMIDGPLKGVNMNKIAANEGPHFLYHYFLRCINRLWDRHESFLRRIGSTKVYVNDSCINDKAMRQTLCYGLLVRTVLSEELLPHLMELKNMLRIIDLSYMSCPSPKIAPSYIMCKQGGFGYSDMRPDGAHAGGKSGDFISANLLAQCIEDLAGNVANMSQVEKSLTFAPASSLDVMDFCHFENIQMVF